MLSYLLPGLRHLRAPLAAGYLWLFAGYLAFAHGFPKHTDAAGVLADVYSLVESVGAPSLIAASAFAAYLLGLLSSELSKLLVRTITRAARWIGGAPSPHPRNRWARLRMGVRRWAGTGGADVSPHGEVVATAIAEERERQIEAMLRRKSISCQTIEENIPLGRAIFLDDPIHVLFEIAEVSELNLPRTAGEGGPSKGLAERMIADLRLSKLRLLEKAPAVFEEVDRIESEAELRLAVVPPLVAVFTVLAFRSSPAWLLAAIPMAILFDQGIRLRKNRGDQIVDAISVGTIEAPELERLTQALKEICGGADQHAVQQEA
jgi:hypothetical protein